MPRELTKREELDIELGLLIEELNIIKNALNNEQKGPEIAFKLIKIKEPSLRKLLNSICGEISPNI